MVDAPTLVPLSLAGGQGKTTVALMVGRILAAAGIPVLMVDADPQANLTMFLGVEVGDDRPTLLEILTKPARKIPLYSAIHTVPGSDRLFCIPANDELEDANSFLASSGVSLSRLRERLYQVEEDVEPTDRVAQTFGLIIIDPPPERSHLALTSLGAGDRWVIPAECNIKGVQSLIRTRDLILEYARRVPTAELTGVIPFRAKWQGLNPTNTTKQSMEAMADIVGQELMLPHLLYSDAFMRAINDQCLPRDLGKRELEHPLERLIEAIAPALPEQFRKLLKSQVGEEVTA